MSPGMGHTPVRVFEELYSDLARHLVLHAPSVDVGEVHAQKTGSKDWISREECNITFYYEIPQSTEALAIDVRPNLPWAEDHFQERVSGQPLNPSPSADHWPFTQGGHKDHTRGGKFSHTYPERMWPKHANHHVKLPYRSGIRFGYGDLNDLVDVLVKNPYTRQAYLPIWFPEDLTAAKQGERVPCTLGYHFLFRDGRLNMTYLIRSCDLVRFFRDDVYMACRLVQWVCQKVTDHELDDGVDDLVPGTLTMHITSLHCFEGDLPMLRRKYAPRA